jgi:hypothetical protein
MNAIWLSVNFDLFMENPPSGQERQIRIFKLQAV